MTARKSYSELLKDPRWQRRRLEILQRADFCCEECGSGDHTLHVHHRVYHNGAMPWEYEDRELVCLCEACHEAEHLARKELTEILQYFELREIDRVLGYAKAMLVAVDIQIPIATVKVKNSEQVDGLADGLWIELTDPEFQALQRPVIALSELRELARSAGKRRVSRWRGH